MLEKSTLDLNQDARRGWFWNGFEQFAQRGLSLLVSLVLARLLEPSAFGLIASVSIFLSIAQQFIDGGIARLIVQKKNLSDDDVDALFWCNLCISSLSVVVLLLLTKPIAAFLNEPRLVLVIPALSLSVFLMNAGRVQAVLLTRDLKFKTLSLFRTISVACGCTVGLTMALLGYGVWALIWQQITNGVVYALMLWLNVKWQPKNLPKWQPVKALYSFGIRILVAESMRSFSAHLINMLIARNYSTTELGYYDRGRVLPQTIGGSCGLVFGKSNFAVMSRIHDQKVMLSRMYTGFLRASVGTVFIIMTGLCVCAEDLIIILLGEKWLPSLWFFQISTILASLYMIWRCSCDLISAMGFAREFLHYSLWGSAAQIVGVTAGAFISIKAMVIGDLIGQLIAVVAMLILVRKVAGISYLLQISSIGIGLVFALALAVTLSFIQSVGHLLWVRVICSSSICLLCLFLFWIVHIKVDKHNRASM